MCIFSFFHKNECFLLIAKVKQLLNRDILNTISVPLGVSDEILSKLCKKRAKNAYFCQW